MDDYIQFVNYFYGQANHYNHPGWYFDVIVDNLSAEEGSLTESNLNNETSVRPGRFVLVKNYGAIFMRSGNNNMFIKPYKNLTESGYQYYYQDKYNLSGKEVNFTLQEEDRVNQWIDENCLGITAEEKEELKLQMYITNGYKFISYTNPNIQIWRGGTAQLWTDFSNTDYLIIDGEDQELQTILETYFNVNSQEE